MNRQRFSTIAHQRLPFACPVSSERFDQLVALLDLPSNARVLDAGCGKAGLLLRIVQRYAAAGVGADPNEAFIQDARAKAVARGLEGRVELHAARVQEIALEAGSFDLAVCIGSTHAFGRFADALKALAELVRPGGQILIADGYWKQPPDPEYLTFLGASLDDMPDHAGNEEAGLAAGLAPLYSCVSNEDEWDHYEGMYCLSMERFLLDHPDDPDAEAFHERIRGWRAAFRRWGRATLGFGMYLFGKPAS